MRCSPIARPTIHDTASPGSPHHVHVKELSTQPQRVVGAALSGIRCPSLLGHGLHRTDPHMSHPLRFWNAFEKDFDAKAGKIELAIKQAPSRTWICSLSWESWRQIRKVLREGNDQIKVYIQPVSCVTSRTWSVPNGFIGFLAAQRYLFR